MIEKRIIEYGLVENGEAYNWLSFDEIKGYSYSIEIDLHIFRHLNNEINFAKEHNIIYSNIDEITSICNKLLKNSFTKIKVKKQQKKKQIKSKKHTLEINENKTYLIKDTRNNFYKIGYSKNPKIREKTLQSENPNIKVVKVWDYNIEKKLHKLYNEFRVRGEWFNLSKIQVRYICTHFNSVN